MKTTYLNQQTGYEKLTLGLTAVLDLAFAGFFFILALVLKQGCSTRSNRNNSVK